MSARSATTGPGLPPFKSATTPVFATLVCGSRPKLRSRSAMYFAVSTSRLDSSGCAWRCRRQAITSGSIAAASRSMSPASAEAGTPPGDPCEREPNVTAAMRAIRKSPMGRAVYSGHAHFAATLSRQHRGRRRHAVRPPRGANLDIPPRVPPRRGERRSVDRRRDPLDARDGAGAGITGGVVGDVPHRELHARRRARDDEYRRMARFHREDRCGRPGARRRRTITGFGRSASSRRSGVRGRCPPRASGESGWRWPPVRTCRTATSTCTGASPTGRIWMPSSISATTFTSFRTADTATARRSAAFRRRTGRSSRSPTTGCGTRSTDRTRTSRRSTASIRSSSCGTTTRSRTTRGVTAPRTTIPTRVKGNTRRGAPRPSSPISNGCRSAKIDRRGSLASIDPSRSAIWRI